MLRRIPRLRIVLGTNSNGIVIARIFRRAQNGARAFNEAGGS
jgi:hypothetical protein